MKPKTLQIGQKINYLEARRFSRIDKFGSSVWFFTCVCGKDIELRVNAVRSGKLSCGCITRHGETAKQWSESKKRIFQTWKSMKERCLYKKHRSYGNYGGRGITICDTWLNFDTFYLDMANGWKPGFSIDRIDFNGNYCKENCRWASSFEQARNRRNNHYIEFNNQRLTITDWSFVTHIPKNRILWRITKGWPLEKALYSSPRKKSPSKNTFGKE